jgi:hypothetical protein
MSFMKPWIVVLMSLLGMALGQMRVGDWTLAVSTDPVTNSKTTLFYTDANEREGTGLALGCISTSRRLVVYILSDRHIGSDTLVRVLWRFDTDSAPTEARIPTATSGKVVYFFGYEKDFVSKLKSSTTLAVRVYTSLGDFYTYTFNVRGFADAFRLLPCNEP